MEAADKKRISTVSDPEGRFPSVTLSSHCIFLNLIKYNDLQVSIQPNGWDCGIYLLQFFRMFIDDPEKYMKIIIVSL